MEIRKLFALNEEYAVSLRREFHMYPELSLQEERTSARIAEELEKLEIPCRIVGSRNVVGVINEGHPGKRIAIRGDIDALPINEEVDLAFKSRNPGVMHACGHDAHTAIVLGIAKTLNGIRDELNGSVYLCFQVAEETGAGADDIVEYLQSLGGVDEVISCHVAGENAPGSIYLPDAAMLSGSAGFKVKVTGVGGHGSRPDLAVDPLRPACEILLKLQAIPANRHNPFDTVVVSPCVIRGGSKANVIPDSAEIEGTVRYFSVDAGEEIMRLMERIAAKTAESYGASAMLETVKSPSPPVINTPEAARRGRALAEKLGMQVLYPPNPGMASDNYALFLRAFPGFYCYLGANSAMPETSGVHHSAKFCLDEQVIINGMEFLGIYAYNFLQ